MARPLALLALALAAPPSPSSAPPAAPGESGRTGAIVAALRAAPAGGARADAATRPLLGSPYVPTPLGEAAGYDPDPRFRLDAFDCMTFAETAVALGSASTLDEARAALDDVRYAEAIAYEGRNHEVLSQWIPANVRKGWVEDVASAVAGPRARVAAVEYDAARWAAVARAGRAIPGVPRARLPVGRFEVGLVPEADVPAVAARIPDGTLAFVVRADLRDRPTRVTHVGLVVRGPGGATLVRHATSSVGTARVIEEPIERFLRREERAAAWRVEGLALLAIHDNRPRVAARRPAAGPPATAAGVTPPARPPGKM
jgi:hypothetical protein